MANLSFGYGAGLVPGVKAAWGARWIVTQDGAIDQLWDRQSAFGDEDRLDRLVAWLDGGANAAARKNASRLLSTYVIRTSEPKPVILHQDPTGAIIGNTNGSYGYMYVAAYLFDDLPDGHPTKGLELVLDHPARNP